jgi:hypothetical protein
LSSGTSKEANEMAVAIEVDFKGATLEQYDQVIGLMGLGPGVPAPPGALFHWVAKTADGIRVVDVWETQEAYEQFARDQIGPYTQQVGISEPPSTKVTEIHNHFPQL